jgi:hypothetical protein
MDSGTVAFENMSAAEGASLSGVEELYRSPSNPYLLYSQQPPDNQPLPLLSSNSDFGIQSSDLGMVYRLSFSRLLTGRCPSSILSTWTHSQHSLRVTPCQTFPQMDFFRFHLETPSLGKWKTHRPSLFTKPLLRRIITQYLSQTVLKPRDAFGPLNPKKVNPSPYSNSTHRESHESTSIEFQNH